MAVNATAGFSTARKITNAIIDLVIFSRLTLRALLVVAVCLLMHPMQSQELHGRMGLGALEEREHRYEKIEHTSDRAAALRIVARDDMAKPGNGSGCGR